MSVKSGLYDLLMADTALQALVAGRVRPVYRPQGGALPSVTTRVKDGSSEYGVHESSSYRTLLYEVDSFGAAYDDAEDVRQRVRAVLERQRGLIGGVQVTRILWDKEEEDVVDEGGVVVFRLRQWFTVQYLKTGA